MALARPTLAQAAFLASIVLGLALIATTLVLFHAPALLEAHLAALSGRQAFPWPVGLGTARVGSAILGLALIIFPTARLLPKTDIVEALALSAVAVPAGLLVVLAGFSTSPDARAIDAAMVARSRVALAEARLGRETPTGQELRQAMGSVQALAAHADLINQLVRSSPDREAVMDLLAAAPLLGAEHPVIARVAANGLIQPGDEERVYRDITVALLENPERSSPAITALLTSLAAR